MSASNPNAHLLEGYKDAVGYTEGANVYKMEEFDDCTIFYGEGFEDEVEEKVKPAKVPKVNPFKTCPKNALVDIMSYMDANDFMKLYNVDSFFQKIAKEALGHKWTEMEKGFNLHDYQYALIEWMKECSERCHYGIVGGIIALEMGLGKTLACIAYTQMYPKRATIPFMSGGGGKGEKGEGEDSGDDAGDIRPADAAISTKTPSLIVCGKTQMMIFNSETKKFYGDRLKCLMYHKEMMPKKEYDNMTREEMNKYDFVIVTYDVCCALAAKYGYSERALVRHEESGNIKTVRHPLAMNMGNMTRDQYAQWYNGKTGEQLIYDTKWPVIFTDEAHRFRNPKSKLFYAMMALDANERWCLSGTPIINSESDIYSLLKFCGYSGCDSPGELSKSRFDREKLEQRIMKVTVGDAKVKLTEKIVHTVNHTFREENERKFYDLYLKGAQEQFVELMKSESPTYTSIFTLLIRLRQICIAPYLVTKESKMDSASTAAAECSIVEGIKKAYPEFSKWLFDKHGTAGMNSTRNHRLVKVINSFGMEKCVVFANFSSALHLAKDAINYFLPHLKTVVIDGQIKGADRTSIIERYKNGEYDVLLMSYKVGSEGHTLIECHNVLLMDWWWNSEIMRQAIARCHRPGQKADVNVYFFEVSNSVETKMKAVCNMKEEMITGFLTDAQKVRQAPKKMDMYTIGRIIGAIR